MADPNRPYPSVGAHGGPPRPSRPPWLAPVAVLVVLVALWAGYAVVSGDDGSSTAEQPTPATDDAEAVEVATTDTTEAPLPPFDGWVNPASSGRMWSEEVPGILTFRGNPTRSYYGEGPVPSAPQVVWTYPQGTMCGNSTDGGGTQTWCGTGWTGQPNVYEQDGRTVVSFGAYDYGVHWLDAESGTDLLPPFTTGDIIKGTVTTDPDGFPITYSGSRDNYYRVLGTDRPGEAVELWKLGATDFGVQKVWNDDWDGSGLVIDDYLFEGGENSWFYIVKLNRAYGPDGLVTVDPEVVFRTPSWDPELESLISDRQFSIENSVAISGNTVYFANSAGLVQGWDITGLKDGVEPTRVFRFWTGDDTDASIVIDPDGFLYVGSEYERRNTRSTEVGQIMKLDPRNAENPLVWSVKDQAPRQAGRVGHPGAGQRRRVRRHQRRPRHGDRPADRCRAVGEEPRLPDVAVTGGGRRPTDHRRLPGRAAGLRRVRSPHRSARGVGGPARRVHRVHPGRVEGPDLRGHAGREDVRPGRPVRGRTAGERDDERPGLITR